MKKILTTAILSINLFALSPSFTIIGKGAYTCQDYLNNKSAFTKLEYIEYVFGYIAGARISINTNDYFEAREEVSGLLQDFCSANPNNYIALAAEQIVFQMK